MWWTTLWLVGAASTCSTQVSFVKPVGRITYWYCITPVAGTEKGLGNWNIMSGLGIVQPWTNGLGAGMSLGSPKGAPVSTQATSVLISLSDNEGAFENFPNWGSANHGGIFFSSTADLIAFAHGRACS